jgi:hypothetical protein
MDDLNFQLTLRPTLYADLETHYQFQLDEEANYLAAFTSSSSSDKKAYLEKYAKFLNEPSINNQTILIDGIIVGSIAKFVIEGDAEITYWIDRKFWDVELQQRHLKRFFQLKQTVLFMGASLSIISVPKKYWKIVVLLGLVQIAVLLMHAKSKLRNLFID